MFGAKPGQEGHLAGAFALRLGASILLWDVVGFTHRNLFYLKTLRKQKLHIYRIQKFRFKQDIKIDLQLAK